MSGSFREAGMDGVRVREEVQRVEILQVMEKFAKYEMVIF